MDVVQWPELLTFGQKFPNGQFLSLRHDPRSKGSSLGRLIYWLNRSQGNKEVKAERGTCSDLHTCCMYIGMHSTVVVVVVVNKRRVLTTDFWLQPRTSSPELTNREKKAIKIEYALSKRGNRVAKECRESLQQDSPGLDYTDTEAAKAARLQGRVNPGHLHKRRRLKAWSIKQRK